MNLPFHLSTVPMNDPKDKSQLDIIAAAQAEAALTNALSNIDRTVRFDKIESRLSVVEEQLTLIAKSATLTEEIRDAIVAAKMGFKVIGGIGWIVKWAGILSAAALSIYGAVFALTHGGVPPK